MSQSARKTIFSAGLLLVALVAAVCDKDSSPTSSSAAPQQIKYISGSDQVGRQLTKLAQPFTVKILDSDGNPLPSYKVIFTVTSLSGTFAGNGKKAQEVVTNSSGLTSTYLVLGSSPDSIFTVEASAVGLTGASLNGSPVIFRATASATASTTPTPGDTTTPKASSILIVTSPGQDTVGAAGKPLIAPRVVKVLDTEGKPVAKVPVYWTVLEGGGSIASAMTLTDDNGLAFGNWTMGPAAGLNRLQAHFLDALGAVHKVVFEVRSEGGTGAAVQVGGPDSIVVISNPGQKGEVGTVLPLPLVVAVYDSSGKLVPGAKVLFTITQGHGSIAVEGAIPSTSPMTNLINQTTNSEGLAAITWMLGPGPDLDNTVVAEIRRADGTVKSVTLHAEALPKPDTANRLYIMSGNYQGSDGSYAAGAILPLLLVVRVVDTLRTGVNGDILGAPISNFPVLFTAYSPGGGALVSSALSSGPGGTGRLEARTDADGLAAVRLTLDTDTGAPDSLSLLLYNNRVIVVAVFADGSQDSVIFSATAGPQAADKIAEAGSTEFKGTAGKVLGNTLGVLVTDQYNNPTAGIPVSFSITDSPGGGSSLSQSYDNTDIYGAAGVSITQLSTKVGTMKIQASNGKLTGSPVTFTVTVEADVPADFRVAGGDGQSSASGTAFTDPLKVLVLDQYGNPVAKAMVTFSIAAGSASVSNSTIQTGDDGTASTTVKPSAAGVITVNAITTINGVTRTLTFSLTAT